MGTLHDITLSHVSRVLTRNKTVEGATAEAFFSSGPTTDIPGRTFMATYLYKRGQKVILNGDSLLVHDCLHNVAIIILWSSILVGTLHDTYSYVMCRGSRRKTRLYTVKKRGCYGNNLGSVVD